MQPVEEFRSGEDRSIEDRVVFLPKESTGNNTAIHLLKWSTNQ